MATRHDRRQVDHVLGGLFRASHAMRTRYEQVARSFGLTPQQARMLDLTEQPVAQRDLAASVGCDASNIVGLVDRLEHLGLVAREPHPDDRRVRLVKRTDKGDRLHRDLQAELYRDVPGLSTLTRAELATLAGLLERIAPPDDLRA